MTEKQFAAIEKYKEECLKNSSQVIYHVLEYVCYYQDRHNSIVLTLIRTFNKEEVDKFIEDNNLTVVEDIRPGMDHVFHRFSYRADPLIGPDKAALEFAIKDKEAYDINQAKEDEEFSKACAGLYDDLKAREVIKG